MPLLPCLALAAATTPQVVTESIPRIGDEVARPELDGRLDEPFWGAALVLRDFEQTLPVAGGTPSERTEILLAYDDTDLYVGLRCYDENPEGIRATQRFRDANLDPDDRVELLFDTFNDNRNGFWFQLGAAGSLGDALISKSGNAFNKPWDGIWYAESRVTDEGWFGEIRIPFATVNFDPENDTWGFNVRRFIRRRTEEVRWQGNEPRLRFFSPATGGKLTGLQGMKQGIGVDLIPFFVGAYTNLDDAPEHWIGEFGGDLFWRISPSTKLSLSYNTDFAETEVDNRQVNLTRFALFFPEKRRFFLEDSGIFTFNRNNGRDPLPYFSRRIGLDDSGNEIPLLANAKLTSANDSYSFGLQDSLTEETADFDARNLFVGRYSKNFLEQSSVGVIATRGDPTGSQEDTTVGADLDLRTDHFLDEKTLRLRAYLLRTEDNDAVADDQVGLAWSTQVSYPNDEVELDAAYTVIEEEFDPALGFVRRSDIRRADATIAYNPRLYSDVRRLRFSLAPQFTTLASGETATKSLAIRPFGVQWESDDQLLFSVTPQSERLFEDFDIQDDVTIPTGTYDFVRWGTSFTTSDRRPVSWEVSYTTGTFFDGDRDDFRTELQWRAGAGAFFSTEYSRNDVRLTDGSFDVNIGRLRADFHFSPWVSWFNFVQWDDVSEQLGLNSRLRWILEPGRDLFFVINQGWSTFDDGFAPVSTDLRAKIAYTFRF